MRDNRIPFAIDYDVAGTLFRLTGRLTQGHRGTHERQPEPAEMDYECVTVAEDGREVQWEDFATIVKHCTDNPTATFMAINDAVEAHVSDAQHAAMQAHERSRA